MKCGQGKPFKSYQMGGLVTKGPAKAASAARAASAPDEGVYTAEKGEPPTNPDMISALPPAQRRAAEARMRAEDAAKKAKAAKK
jgi:hypothetical protein